jgi:DNA-binding transcriptional regulator YdaS (Cro superfamily)
MCNVKKAVALIGGQTKTGEALGVSQQTVSYWVVGQSRAPAKYFSKISELTDGKITVNELLADHENNHVETGSNRV